MQFNSKRVSLLIISFFLILCVFSASAQDYDSTGKPIVTLKTPFNTVMIHLSYLQPDSYKPEIAAQALSIVDPNSEDGQELAHKLIKIYDGKGFIVDIDKIPHEANYTDPATGMHKYVIYNGLPQIYVEKYGDKWLYSIETVKAIPDIYEKMYPVDISQITDNLPQFFRIRILGIQIWKLCGLVIYFLIGFILFKIISWIFDYFLIKIFKKFTTKSIFSKYVHRVAKPISLFIVLIIASNFLSLLELPLKFSFYLNLMIKAFMPIAITAVAYNLSEMVGDMFGKIAAKTPSKFDDQMVPLIRKSLKVTAVVLGGIYVISSLGVDITPILAGASIGGLAFALAAQDTLKNLFGSVTIFSDRPFELGDWIVFDGAEGMVEEVGLRSTRIRTFYNSLISIPNGKLADLKIDNMGRREFRRFFTNITITYDTPPDLIDAFVEGLREIVTNHPHTRKDYFQIHLNDLGSTSINILFYIFFAVPDWGLELQSKHEIISDIIKLADKLGVRFAFPTQTIHIEEFPERKSLTPVYSDDPEQFRKQLEEYKSSRFRDKKS